MIFALLHVHNILFTKVKSRNKADSVERPECWAKTVRRKEDMKFRDDWIASYFRDTKFEANSGSKDRKPERAAYPWEKKMPMSRTRLNNRQEQESLAGPTLPVKQISSIELIALNWNVCQPVEGKNLLTKHSMDEQMHYAADLRVC